MTLDTDQIVTVVTTGDRASSTSGTVLVLDLSRFQTGRWALQLDGVFAKRTQPVCVIARGVAALAVAWWAQLSPRSYMKSIRGAIFVAPLSIGLGQDGIAAAARGGPITQLPFPSIVAASSDFGIDQMRKFADGWGSYLIDFSSGGSERPASPIEAELVDILGSTNAVPPLDQLSPLGTVGITQMDLNVG